MEQFFVTPDKLAAFEEHLLLEERSPATIRKYMRAVHEFLDGFPDAVTKSDLIARKEAFAQRKAAGTVNGMITALNRFLSFHRLYGLRVKYLREQRRIFSDKERELEREEYLRLIQAAEARGNRRLALVIQTIGATGIRVSELEYITVDAARRGQAVVRCKGKSRTVFLPKKLQKTLLRYCREQGRMQGSIFVTRSGRPLDRSNIWSEMKRLCRESGVSAAKVFPHNLRHLFARVFYSLDRDLAKLADLLGHTRLETTRIYIMESGASHRRRLEQMRLIC